ncbi:anti-repressor SinI family protein [Metabacillus halosaccharovorans]|nr:anti-repressor SinI family protein [Metabacillus halosaccharovorans]MBU7595953.1 DNA-binding anti-repressor SinI [Metabacillus halosaccharovorans]
MNRNLDKEWLHLILEAKKLGISIEEIRLFLRSV